jgi:hypothetical protein
MQTVTTPSLSPKPWTLNPIYTYIPWTLNPIYTYIYQDTDGDDAQLFGCLAYPLEATREGEGGRGRAREGEVRVVNELHKIHLEIQW